MFLLGLRHGLDPDHIACIDGLTWKCVRRGHARARWVGSLFALGHGLLVTAMAVLISHLSVASLLPREAWALLEWAPTVLLIVVGFLNLEALMRQDSSYAPRGWKMAIIPRRLRDSDSPWAIVMIGVLFATVFDTATQASAWSYVASAPQSGWQHALAAGLTFTAGMLVTDTIDSQIVSRVGSAAGSDDLGRRYRRVLGWTVVCMAFGVAGYNIVKTIAPEFELDDASFTAAGAVLVGLVALIGVRLWWARRAPLHSA